MPSTWSTTSCSRSSGKRAKSCCRSLQSRMRDWVRRPDASRRRRPPACARCTPSRGARGWPARCAWAKWRTGWKPPSNTCWRAARPAPPMWKRCWRAWMPSPASFDLLAPGDVGPSQPMRAGRRSRQPSDCRPRRRPGRLPALQPERGRADAGCCRRCRRPSHRAAAVPTPLSRGRAARHRLGALQGRRSHRAGCRWPTSRRPARPRCACARRCSTGWSTRPARSASRARASSPMSARSRARSAT